MVNLVYVGITHYDFKINLLVTLPISVVINRLLFYRRNQMHGAANSSVRTEATIVLVYILLVAINFVRQRETCHILFDKMMIQNEQRHLKSLFYNMEEGILVFKKEQSEKGDIIESLLANPAFETVTGIANNKNLAEGLKKLSLKSYSLKV